MAGVKLNHVWKRYGDVEAVKDFHLDIQDKEFIVFVGPSGCGKSTTLRMIAGLEEISEGELYIGERKVNDVAPKDRDIAMVFQNYALYPHMNVYDNMAFGLKLRKFPKKDIEKRVKEAAKILGIEPYLKRKPKELSGGQRQRVALGRAIVREPQVFLMDEPLSNLDAKLRVQMRAEILKLHERIQTTTIYVTHDQTEAMTMATRIVIMKDGIIQQVGTPQEVYDVPVNRFVGGFIGSPAMNFIKGNLKEESGKILFQAEGIQVEIPAGKAQKIKEQGYVDRAVYLGIRPEDIHDEPLVLESSPKTHVHAKVEVVELTGAEKYLHISVAGEVIIARVDARSNVKVGTEVEMAFDPNKLHFFDADTDQRIDA
ncbi:sn-glycerol-3-phosphate ABC transporter ATP-binding protein UgpC [Microaerobacter geothermalis]|uniref:ABC transporter ATP-binding protein n=1 Tax=Microaerobacter geothermalis TaxID=674972 RepID=UPI001F3301D9|nr:sn-glycerol-3-phosphate ABC transporter ATP-binding protein UgpC [Microaerobacter geothermalis]MCF6094277.1 sn-glycerol-3-phosphate ABC transporter ATP-binding protein UgpC [Microaerobacter geothermalis]